MTSPLQSVLLALLLAVLSPRSASCQVLPGRKTPIPQPLLELGKDDSLDDVAFTPDGRFLAAASHFGYVPIWEIPSGRLMRTLPGRSVYYSHEWSRGKKAKSLFRYLFCGALPVCRGHSEDVTALAFSPDGKTLATAGDDGKVRLWDWAKGRQTRVLKHPLHVTTLAFLPEGRFIVTGTYAESTRTDSAEHPTITASHVRLWDIKKAEVVADAQMPAGITSLSVDRQGSLLAVGLHGKPPRLLTLPDLEPDRTIEGEPLFTTAELSPDGRMLLTAGHDNRPKGRIGIFDLATGRAWSYPDPSPSKIRLTRDGLRAISVSYLKTATLWELSTGRKLAVYPHPESVTSVALSPDGKHFATTTVVNPVRVWALPRPPASEPRTAGPGPARGSAR